MEVFIVYQVTDVGDDCAFFAEDKITLGVFSASDKAEEFKTKIELEMLTAKENPVERPIYTFPELLKMSPEEQEEIGKRNLVYWNFESKVNRVNRTEIEIEVKTLDDMSNGFVWDN